MAHIKAGPDREEECSEKESTTITTATIPPSTMKLVFALILTLLLAVAVHGSALLEPRIQGNYVQKSSGTASFTYYYGCGEPGKPH